MQVIKTGGLRPPGDYLNKTTKSKSHLEAVSRLLQQTARCFLFLQQIRPHILTKAPEILQQIRPHILTKAPEISYNKIKTYRQTPVGGSSDMIDDMSTRI